MFVSVGTSLFWVMWSFTDLVACCCEWENMLVAQYYHELIVAAPGYST